MGPGNRMKKQGPPPPLDESLVSKKRKQAPSKPAPPPKKQRTNNAPTKITVEKVTGPMKQISSFKKTPIAPPPKKAVNAKSTGNTQKRIAEPAEEELDEDLESFDEDDISDSDDGIDDPDVMEDEFDTAEADRLELASSSDEEDLNGADKFEEIDSDSDVVDSDQERKPNGMWSDDEGSDAEEQLNAANIEGMSRKLDQEAARQAAEAQAELEEAAMQTNIAGDGVPGLDDGDASSDDEPGLKTRLAPDLQLLRTRITDTVRVLDEWKKSTEHARSRAEYIKQLLKDVCAYYGYSMFLATKLFNLFSPREAFAFFEANETPRPIVLRTNSLRTNRRQLAQALINRGVTLEPVGKWSKVGLQVFESGVPLGATPEYLAGHYIMQAASSFLPVMALAPQEGERVLDMAAAPGGKTTHMAALMKNTGCIFANDSNKTRAKALIGNIHRLGAKNTIVCNYNAMEFPKVIGGFDRVLLDAPCSGTGVIAKDPSVKTNKTEKDFLRLPHLQKQLLLAAIDSVDHSSKTGGYIVYSTCSVTVEENEQVVQYALSRRPNVKLVETGLVFGKEGFTNYMGKKFDRSLSMTRRYYPHAYNVDGFFVSKFKKTGPSPAGKTDASGVTEASNDIAVEKKAVKGSKLTVTPPELSESAADDDEFGGFDDSADEELIEKAKRNAMRRKGLNPKADKSKAKPKGTKKSTEAKSSKKLDDAAPVIARPGPTAKVNGDATEDVPLTSATKDTVRKRQKQSKANAKLNAGRPATDASAAKRMIIAGLPKQKSR